MNFTLKPESALQTVLHNFPCKRGDDGVSLGLSLTLLHIYKGNCSAVKQLKLSSTSPADTTFVCLAESNCPNIDLEDYRETSVQC